MIVVTLQLGPPGHAGQDEVGRRPAFHAPFGVGSHIVADHRGLFRVNIKMVQCDTHQWVMLVIQL